MSSKMVKSKQLEAHKVSITITITIKRIRKSFLMKYERSQKVEPTSSYIFISTESVKINGKSKVTTNN